VPLTLAFSAGDTEVSIANIFNDIIPGLLGLLLSLGVFKMLRKKVNPNLIIVLLFAVSLIGAAIGIF
jgi:mannose/fructose/N-acetylgalactosamine-specific phosphotransferase system component IID